MGHVGVLRGKDRQRTVALYPSSALPWCGGCSDRSAGVQGAKERLCSQSPLGSSVLWRARISALALTTQGLLVLTVALCSSDSIAFMLATFSTPACGAIQGPKHSQRLHRQTLVLHSALPGLTCGSWPLAPSACLRFLMLVRKLEAQVLIEGSSALPRSSIPSYAAILADTALPPSQSVHR